MSMRIHIITLFPILSTTHRRYPQGDFPDKESSLCPSMDCSQRFPLKGQEDTKNHNRSNRSCTAPNTHTCARGLLMSFFFKVPRIQPGSWIHLEFLCAFPFAKSVSSTNANVCLGCLKTLIINHRWNKVDLEEVQRAHKDDKRPREASVKGMTFTC